MTVRVLKLVFAIYVAGVVSALSGTSSFRLHAQAKLAVSNPLPPKVPSKDEVEKLKADYDRVVAARAQSIAKLPKGSAMALDVAYEKNAFQGVRPESNQKLDLYVPPGKGPFPLIIYIHGGAWKGGERETRGVDMAMRWLPEGFAIASIDYRFVFDAQFPGMFQDGIDAVAFLRAHASQYRLDAKRFGIIGESAGAHIAGVVAMAEGGKAYPNTGPALQGAVLLCGFYDMTRDTGEWKPNAMIDNPRDDFSNLFPNRTYDATIARQMSPVYLIHSGIPPVLLVRGDEDPTAPLVQSQIFEAALRKAGAEVKFSRYPTYTHNLWKPDVIAEALEYFKKNLKVTPATTH